MSTDKQMTGMAGEFLAVGKLFKKGIQASITFGNAKAIDIIVNNPENEKPYLVQVKTSRKKKKDFRGLKFEDIKDNSIYVFIVLNEFENNEEFFIVRGSVIKRNVEKFYGASINKDTVRWGSLTDYQDNWKEFDK
jgi:hypothetical protein